MKDCNGDILTVGSAVEVVKQPNEVWWDPNWKPTGTVRDISKSPELAWVIGNGVRNWFASRELRLVRKEPR